MTTTMHKFREIENHESDYSPGIYRSGRIKVWFLQCTSSVRDSYNSVSEEAEKSDLHKIMAFRTVGFHESVETYPSSFWTKQ